MPYATARETIPRSRRSLAALAVCCASALPLASDAVGQVWLEADPHVAQANDAEGKAPAAKPRSAPTAPTLPGIDEIVVTARKRAERLEDTPVSVTALDQDALQEQQVQTLDDLKTQVPNFTFYKTAGGQTGVAVIRGVGRFPLLHFDQGVGIYVDGIYLSRNAGTVLDIVDIQQIEILRGPQGTLFGKNTVGGAINITTIPPSEELEAFGSVRAGSFDTVDTRVMLNLPAKGIEEKLSTRLTFASFNSGGYTRNTLLDERYSDRHALDFYGALRFAPIDAVTLTVTGTWARDHNRGLGGQCVFYENNQNPLGFLIDLQYPDYRQSCERSRPFRFESELSSAVSDVTSSGVWGVLDWQIGDISLLENLSTRVRSSWREQTPRARIDTELSPFPVLNSESLGGDGDLHGIPGFQRQIQQELQVNGNAWDKRISFVTGVFTYWEDARAEATVSYLPENLSLVRLESITTDGSIIDNRDWALYGQATADVTDWASLTAGVRYTEEKKSFSRVLRTPTELLENPEACAFNPTPGAANCGTFAEFDDEATSDAWTPMASLALKAPAAWLDASGFLDHAMPYFTYSRGFTGGGLNGTARSNDEQERATFEPEFINSYEWGIKLIAVDRRLSFNAAYFIADRFDQQVLQAIQDDSGCVPGEMCIPQLRVITTNAAKSKTDGFELELLATPLRGLNVNASVGYLNTRFVEYPDGVNAITNETFDRAGESFAFVPDWTTHLGAQYAWELPRRGPDWLQGFLTPRVDWSYTSAVVHFAPEVHQLRQPGYHLVNFRLSYDFNEERSEIAFWAKNLTDETYFTNALSWGRLTGSGTRYYDPPRAFGVEISQRF